MPGVLIIEAMAQASIILFYGEKDTAKKRMNYYLGSVKVRFLHPVVPGDQLKIAIEPIKVISGAAIVKAQAFVGDKEVAGGEISFVAKES
jgi:3-hydroxyacyl-[acyl-carrier-protein] dehydratase